MITSEHLDNFFNVIDISTRTQLCEIMTNNGSDKGGDIHHNYTRLYNYIFSEHKDKPLNIFEMGIGTCNENIPCNIKGYNGKPGGSLYGWREYFTNAQVYGADIDKEILFTDDRILTFYADQLSSDSLNYLFNQTLKDIMFDIIVDDGLHTFEANFNFLNISINKLKTGGVYIIEDLLDSTMDQLTTSLTSDFFKLNNIKIGRMIKIPHHKNHSDNNLAVFVK